jgi:hypothetical protein
MMPTMTNTHFVRFEVFSFFCISFSAILLVSARGGRCPCGKHKLSDMQPLTVEYAGTEMDVETQKPEIKMAKLQYYARKPMGSGTNARVSLGEKCEFSTLYN